MDCNPLWLLMQIITDRSNGYLNAGQCLLQPEWKFRHCQSLINLLHQQRKLRYQESVLPEETLLLMMLKRGKITFFDRALLRCSTKTGLLWTYITNILKRYWSQDVAQTLQEMKWWRVNHGVSTKQHRSENSHGNEKNRNCWKCRSHMKQPCVHIVADPAAAAPYGLAPFHIIKFYSKLSLWN